MFSKSSRSPSVIYAAESELVSVQYDHYEASLSQNLTLTSSKNLYWVIFVFMLSRRLYELENLALTFAQLRDLNADSGRLAVGIQSLVKPARNLQVMLCIFQLFFYVSLFDSWERQ